MVTTRNQEKYSCKYKASVEGMPNNDGGDGEVEVGKAGSVIGTHHCHCPWRL